MSAPKVFVSYSHEDPAHDAWVLELASLLRRNGVDAFLDQWDLRAGQDVALFMESSIRDSDFVVLICTPTYAQKSNLPRGGVGYEKNIISAEMLQAQDLRPKFVPVLRLGDFATSLPTYLGSRYGVDFRTTRDQQQALEELLRALLEVPPSKPPLGRSPFEPPEGAVVAGPAPATPITPMPSSDQPSTSSFIQVGGHVEAVESRAGGRFSYLRETKIDKAKGDPFSLGFWQASFALQGQLKNLRLPDFLQVLRDSKTGRTGWDIGWVPTRDGISPYPFQDGIEVWLAENGGKGPAHSDFWRAERIGTFSLFRGYQEDEAEFKQHYPNIGVDFSLVLWRISELLLYAENFSRLLGDGDVHANVRIRWTGLDGRRLGFHKALFGDFEHRTCRQPMIESQRHVPNVTMIKPSLVEHVHELTAPLFEAFDFFSLSRDQIKQHIAGLIDVEKEAGT